MVTDRAPAPALLVFTINSAGLPGGTGGQTELDWHVSPACSQASTCHLCTPPVVTEWLEKGDPSSYIHTLEAAPYDLPVTPPSRPVP